MHTRAVTYDGYKRADGLIDIEAHMTDTKDHDYALLTGVRPAGTPIHEMWVRVTIDMDLTVHDIEAVTESMPYPGACNRITPEYRRLIGANLAMGFRKRLHDDLGHVQGCTHLTEMLSYLPTAAFQTLGGFIPEDDGRTKPFQLDKCHALETSTDTVQRFYPKWYRPAVADSPIRHAPTDAARRGEAVSPSAEETK
ncbi:MAG: DUF2889 domain-containing protein [Burkholderiales bacterium]